jgi:hypothetical protein
MATTTASPEKQLAGFIAKFTPEMATFIRAARRKMRALLPNAVELVYDNYNFLVIGYGPGERPSDAIFSLAAQAKGVALCFLQGAGLPDPEGLLRGSGNVVRSIRLDSPATLDRADVRALVKTALARAKTPLEPGAKHRLVIRSVSAKQRPRRAAASSHRTRPRSPRGRAALSASAGS